MELRRLSLYLALFVLAICSQSCSDAHSMQRRGADDIYDDDALMGDEATDDDEAQNDAEGNDAEEEEIPETLLTRPTSYNVTAGNTVRLECKMEPNNNPVIQWLKDGEPLFIGKTPLLRVHKRLKLSSKSDEHDLIITDLQSSDSGRYTCQVMQRVEPNKVDHDLLVLEAPRIISFVATDNGTVVEGANLLLTCNVAGNPPPQILWSTDGADGMNVRLQEKDATFTLNTAFISNIRHDQAGRYYCYALNSEGHMQAELTVRVLHRPRVHVHKTVVNSALDIEAVLHCSAHGDPIPHMAWYKDGRLIDLASSKYVIRTEGPHSNLTLTPREDLDFGTFTCEARNEHGKHNKSIELVQRPVVEGLDLEGNKLSWKVHSHQPLEQMELQLRDTEGTPTTVNVPVPETKGHEYDFIYVLDNVDQGTYEVVVKAKNSKEWSGASEPVVVNYEAPLPIQTASVYHGNSHSIRPASSVVISTLFMYLLVRLF